MLMDINSINDSPHLLDILIQVENVLDTADIYVFDNWIDGEVVEGPIVRRHWIDVTLRYPRDKRPDPRGAKRLINQNLRVDYQKARRGADNTSEEDAKPEDLFWLVRISVPRNLIVQIDDALHDFYDEDIDIGQVEDAKDSGIDEETAFMDEED